MTPGRSHCFQSSKRHRDASTRARFSNIRETNANSRDKRAFDSKLSGIRLVLEARNSQDEIKYYMYQQGKWNTYRIIHEERERERERGWSRSPVSPIGNELKGRKVRTYQSCMTFARLSDSPPTRNSRPDQSESNSRERCESTLTAASFLSSLPPSFVGSFDEAVGAGPSKEQQRMGLETFVSATAVPKDTRERRHNVHESNTDDRLRFLASRGPFEGTFGAAPTNRVARPRAYPREQRQNSRRTRPRRRAKREPPASITSVPEFRFTHAIALPPRTRTRRVQRRQILFASSASNLFTTHHHFE